ncbi:MAG: DUF302 domain-containing protein [Minwuia sp.]|uniref:DUF302 domain-containing protein n=1 Tax=Minwuia sp. TaxID=2493630 RepID=UPI003A877E29
MPIIRILLAASVALAVAGTAQAAEDDGLIRKESAHGVYVTIDKFKAELEARGLTVFTDIDHSAGAARAGMELRPTRIVIFGNPELGTPLMQAAPSMAIDLPQKALAYRDDDGNVWLVYNDPDYLKTRHGLEGQDEVLERVKSALDAMTDAATRP